MKYNHGCWFNKDLFGILCTVVVYALIVQIYVVTLLYGVINDVRADQTRGYINLLILSILTVLTLYSHVMCIFTNPGTLPKHYDQLNEAQLPKAFNKLLRERETMY